LGFLGKLKAVASITLAFISGAAAALTIEPALSSRLSQLSPQDMIPMSLSGPEKHTYLLNIVNMEMADASKIDLAIIVPENNTIARAQLPKMLGGTYRTWKVTVPQHTKSVKICLNYEDKFGIFSLPRHSTWTLTADTSAILEQDVFKIADKQESFFRTTSCSSAHD